MLRIFSCSVWGRDVSWRECRSEEDLSLGQASFSVVVPNELNPVEPSGSRKPDLIALLGRGLARSEAVVDLLVGPFRSVVDEGDHGSGRIFRSSSKEEARYSRRASKAVAEGGESLSRVRQASRLISMESMILRA